MKWAPGPGAHVTIKNGLKFQNEGKGLMGEGKEILSLDYPATGTTIISDGEEIWATQAQIAELFEVNVPAISKHLSNIFSDGELDQNSVISKMETTASDGKSYETQHYNLDCIISVGYRVNSSKATKFRKWATQTLNRYLQDGYVLNEEVLSKSPDKLNKLAATIRALRFEEKNAFAAVRECFKISATDYDKASQAARSFYALLQDKFHHAVTKMTASKLIMDRADHSEHKMGLTHTKSQIPTLQEAKVGKNYLTSDELHRLHLLSEQFLMFAESAALRDKKYTMDQLHQKLDDLLEFNEYPVFDGYKNYNAEDAKAFAEKEYARYILIKRLEHIGIDVNSDLLDEGAYNDYIFEAEQVSIASLNKHAKALVSCA